MRFWGVIRKIPWVYGVSTRNRSQSKEDIGHTRNDLSKDSKRGTGADKKDRCPQQVHSKTIDKCMSFFKTLKQAFSWTDECEAAFQELKQYLSSPPLLSPSKEGENLYLYLAVSASVVSAALIREEGKKQLPVYYVSQAFQGAEFRYPRIEKIAFALIVASRKLR